MLKFLFIFTLIFNSYAQSCPEDSFEVDFGLNSDFKIVVGCFKNVNGKSVKHGPEKTFDQNKKLLKVAHYLDGKLVANTKEHKQKSSLDKEIDAVKTLISRLLVASTYAKKEARKDESITFSTKSCKGRSQDWFNLFLSKKKFYARYKFDKGCDLDGAWAPQLDKFFQVNFKVKNLIDFKKVSFSLKLSRSQSLQDMKSGVKVSLKVKDGVISNKSKRLYFNANYQGTVDPMNSLIQKRLHMYSQQGEVNFTKLNDKEIDIKESFQLNF